jgi:flagellar motility protein MotE (MotC chaperone)
MKFQVCFGIAFISSLNPSFTEERTPFPEKEIYTREEVAALKASLDQKVVEEAQSLDVEKKYLDSLKSEIAQHLAKIDAARNEIASFMSQKDEREEAKLRKLTKFYEEMEAEQAAKLFERFSDDMAMKLLDRMNLRKAVGILSLMPVERAARLSNNYPKLKLQADKPQGGRN